MEVCPQNIFHPTPLQVALGHLQGDIKHDSNKYSDEGSDKANFLAHTFPSLLFRAHLQN